MSQHDFTVKELEQLVFNHSKCYADSEAFQQSLDFIKEVNHSLYKDLLYKEVIEGGLIED